MEKRQAEALAQRDARFINLHSKLIPKLDRLGLSFNTIHDFLNGDLSDAELKTLLPPDLAEASEGEEGNPLLPSAEISVSGARARSSSPKRRAFGAIKPA